MARAEVKVLLREIADIEGDIIHLHHKAKKLRDPDSIYAKIDRKKEQIQRLVDKMQGLLDSKSWWGGKGTRKRSTQKKDT